MTKKFSYLALSSVALLAMARAEVILDTGVTTLNAGDPTQSGRLSRSGVPSDWSITKPFPGTLNVGTIYHYRSFTVTPKTAYVQVTVDDPDARFFVSGYQNSFNPAAFSTNYAGDEGGTGNAFGAPGVTTGDPGNFQIVAPVGQPLVLVVNDTVASNGGLGHPFRVLVEEFSDTMFTDPNLCSIIPTAANIPVGGATGNVAVTCSSPTANWTAVSTVPWVIITGGASGTGSGAVTYLVSSNGTGAPRSTTLTIAGTPFTVNQDGTPSATLSPTSASFGSGGGGSTVGVTTSGSWTAVSNSPWIHITSGASGSGNGTVVYSVDPNPTSSTRMGTMTIAGQTFTVTESGQASITLSPASANVPATGSVGTFSVTTLSPTTSWTAVSNAPWLIVIGGSSGTGSGAVTYLVQANGTGVPRGGTITVGTAVFTVNQSN